MDRALLMRRVLRLRRFELDFDGLLFFVDIELLSVRLIVLSDYLNQDLALGDRWNSGHAVLIGLQLPTCADLLTDLHRTACDESDNHAGAVHGLVFEGVYFDPQLGGLRAGRSGEKT